MSLNINRKVLSRRQALGGMAAAIGAGLAAPARASVPQSSSDILIGQSAVFSGPSAALGIEMRQGIQASFAKANLAGGIDSRKLVLVDMDDGYEPARATANTKELLSRNVAALLGYVGTPTTVACLETINQARIPLVGPYTGAKVLRTPLNPWVFNIRASYDEEAVPIVRQLTAIAGPATAIGIVYQDDGYGLAVKAAAESTLATLGMKFTALATVKRNSLEVDAAADAMANAKVDAVILALTYAPSALVMQAIRARKRVPQFGSVSFIGTSGLLDAYPKQARGLAIAQVMPSPNAIALPVVVNYRKAMNAISIDKYTYGSMEGYLAAEVMIAGIRKAGPSATRVQLMKALETLDLDFKGFQVAFTPETRQGSRFTELTVIGDNGKMVR